MVEENTETRRQELRRNQPASPKNSEIMRGQQEHDEEKIIQKAETVKGQQEPKIDKSLLSREKAEDEVIRHFEKTEGSRKITGNLVEGNESDMEQWNLHGVVGIGR